MGRRIDTRRAANTARELEREVANTRFLTLDGGTFRREKLRKVQLMNSAAEVIRGLLNRVAEVERELEEAKQPTPNEPPEYQPAPEPPKAVPNSGIGWRRESLTAQEERDAVEIAGFTHGGHYGKEPSEVRLAITMARSRIIEEAGNDADRARERGDDSVPFDERVAAIEKRRRERNRASHDEWVRDGRK